MRIGVFAGDLFWSSCPYEHLNIAHYFGKHANTDLIMFTKDIRLNKKFVGHEKFRFEPSLFSSFENLRLISNWDDLVTVSSDYDAIFANCKIVPKTRTPSVIAKRGSFHCPFVALDVGGTDQMSDSTFADLAVSKTPLWAERASAVWKIPAVGLGCHQYDYYLDNKMQYGARLSKDAFSAKYRVNPDKTLLIAPTNPGSHLEMYAHSLSVLERVCRVFVDQGFDIILKTYPHDYLFYESDLQYTGVYKRVSPFAKGRPQYEHLSREFGFPVVESQDHHAAISYSKYMFNMSGSHAGWETHFSKCRSFSINYQSQKFYGKVVTSAGNFDLPDVFTTLDLSSYDQLLEIPDRKAHDIEQAQRFLPNAPLFKQLSEVLDFVKERA